ncbi:MAG TPA: N,N-dimethylformamidase beta subunit family domain-containing protein [Polyangiaceae bacterium]|nr:N,N-dimethylformamidase beta subunit family domain-containing protein [Polyangiaceae bacterium]
MLGAFNIYNNHSSGAPAYQVGTKMPWAAYPYMNYYGPPHNYSHLLRAERFLHVWLEQNGYEYDVASDFDVHQNPSLFNSYKVVVIAGHSEYWSAQAYSGLKQYVANGGRVFVASGNTMNGSAWVPATGAWDDTLGGQFQATLQAVQWAPNYVSILGVNSAGQLLYRYWDGSAWQPTAGFSTYAAAITGRPTAVGLGRNQLYIYARGTKRRHRGQVVGWSELGTVTHHLGSIGADGDGKRSLCGRVSRTTHRSRRAWDQPQALLQGLGRGELEPG